MILLNYFYNLLFFNVVIYLFCLHMCVCTYECVEEGVCCPLYLCGCQSTTCEHQFSFYQVSTGDQIWSKDFQANIFTWQLTLIILLNIYPYLYVFESVCICICVSLYMQGLYEHTELGRGHGMSSSSTLCMFLSVKQMTS